MPVLTMREAEKHYKIDKKVIRRTIAEYPDFPNTPPPPGRPSLGYKLDTEAIDQWLLLNSWAYGESQHNPAMHARAMMEEEARERGEPYKVMVPTNEAVQKLRNLNTAKSTKVDVQTQLLQLELDKKMGKLVSRDSVIEEFAPKISRLAKGLEMMPNLFGRKFGLNDKQIKQMRDYMDELRSTLTRDDGGILSDRYEAKIEDD